MMTFPLFLESPLAVMDLKLVFRWLAAWLPPKRAHRKRERTGIAIGRRHPYAPRSGFEYGGDPIAGSPAARAAASQAPS